MTQAQGGGGQGQMPVPPMQVELSTPMPVHGLLNQEHFNLLAQARMSSDNVTIMVDTERIVRIYTGRNLDKWGREPGIVVGGRYDEMLGDKEGRRRSVIIDDVLGEGRPITESNYRYESATRGEVTQNITYSPLSVAGKAIGVQIEIEDVTRKNLLEQITREIAGSLELDKVLERICVGASALVGVWKTGEVPKAAVRLVDRDGNVRVVGGSVKGKWEQSQLDSLRAKKGGIPGGEKLFDTPMEIIPLSGLGGGLSGNLIVCDVEPEPGDKEFLDALGTRATIAIKNAVDHQSAVEAGRLAEDRLTALQVLAASFAHGVKNPLNSMGLVLGLTSASLKSARGKSPGEMQRIIDESLGDLTAANDAIQRVNLLAESVRDGAAGKSDKMTIDVKPLVEEATTVYRPRAEKEGVEWAVEIPDDLRTIASRTEMTVIVQGLVQNAVEHVKPGKTGARRIRIASKPEEGNRISIEVENTGHIEEEVMDRIFERKEGSGTAGGWGEGLWGVQNLVLRNGGEIWATQSEDTVRFRFTLPRPKTEPPREVPAS